MAIETQLFDVAEYLDDDETIAAFLSEALATDDQAYICHALGQVARARGMAEIARRSGIKREALYRALSKDGNPEFGTILRVIRSLGLRLEVSPQS
jgi:probable addiction module antidote protein